MLPEGQGVLASESERNESDIIPWGNSSGAQALRKSMGNGSEGGVNIFFSDDNVREEESTDGPDSSSEFVNNTSASDSGSPGPGERMNDEKGLEFDRTNNNNATVERDGDDSRDSDTARPQPGENSTKASSKFFREIHNSELIVPYSDMSRFI